MNETFFLLGEASARSIAATEDGWQRQINFEAVLALGFRNIYFRFCLVQRFWSDELIDGIKLSVSEIFSCNQLEVVSSDVKSVLYLRAHPMRRVDARWA